MENASNALLMAAGILIGILILSLGAFLFIDFSQTSRETQEIIARNQITQYNVQFTIYSDRDDITIHDIITIANLAKENNESYKDYTDFENSYKIQVILDRESNNLQDETSQFYDDLINNYLEVGTINPGDSDEERGVLTSTFTSSTIEYHSNGRIKLITFEEN